jgi:hypothetical protein
VVVDPGTDLSTGRLKEKYTWFRDKYWLRTVEVVDNPPLAVTFDFKPVPKLTWKTMKNPLVVNFIGYYSGNHASPHAPRIEIYDHVGTDWEAVAGGTLSLGRSSEEWITVSLPFADKYWDSDNNVRIRVYHPPVAGTVTHELNINHLGLAIGGVTTTTSTTTTTP